MHDVIISSGSRGETRYPPPPPSPSLILPYQSLTFLHLTHPYDAIWIRRLLIYSSILKGLVATSQ